jgi:hypothetical protein
MMLPCFAFGLTFPHLVYIAPPGHVWYDAIISASIFAYYAIALQGQPSSAKKLV